MMQRDESDTRTPPQIVQAADVPEAALSAFIGQELEHWGFNVSRPIRGEDRILTVYPPGRELGTTLIVKVTVRR